MIKLHAVRYSLWRWYVAAQRCTHMRNQLDTVAWKLKTSNPLGSFNDRSRTDSALRWGDRFVFFVAHTGVAHATGPSASDQESQPKHTQEDCMFCCGTTRHHNKSAMSASFRTWHANLHCIYIYKWEVVLFQVGVAERPAMLCTQPDSTRHAQRSHVHQRKIHCGTGAPDWIAQFLHGSGLPYTTHVLPVTTPVPLSPSDRLCCR